MCVCIYMCVFMHICICTKIYLAKHQLNQLIKLITSYAKKN